MKIYIFNHEKGQNIQFDLRHKPMQWEFNIHTEDKIIDGIRSHCYMLKTCIKNLTKFNLNRSNWMTTNELWATSLPETDEEIKKRKIKNKKKYFSEFQTLPTDVLNIERCLLLYCSDYYWMWFIMTYSSTKAFDIFFFLAKWSVHNCGFFYPLN